MAYQCPYCNKVAFSDQNFRRELMDGGGNGFEIQCPECERMAAVHVRMEPIFTVHKRKCERCHKIEISDEAIYCGPCKAEIQRNTKVTLC